MKKLFIMFLIFILIGGLAVGGFFIWKDNSEKDKPLVDNDTGSTKENKPTQKEVIVANDTGSTKEDAVKSVRANNKFALDIYSEMDSAEENVFYSPYSISSAFAMTYEGARGKTAEEIKSVFHYPNKSTLRLGYANLYNELQADKKYDLNVANALWIQKNFKLLDSYTRTVKNSYAAKAENLDFASKPEESRKKINGWVENKTQDKIKDLLPPPSISGATRLVLTNAIYFKGDWKSQFNETNTREADFKTPSGKVQAKMMYQKEDFAYSESNNLKVLKMPYKGENISMVVLLPKENKTLEDIELNRSNLAKWKNSFHTEEFEVYFPKFEFKKKYKMNKILKEMGMPSAFGQNADFSGLTGRKGLYITDVFHQSFVKVNEEGTEATGSTAVVLGETAAKPQKAKTFRADKPFIFIIQQESNENILFIGKVNNPNE